VASSRHDQIEVAFQIVVSGDKISRVAPDGCFQDFVVIGITACPQVTGDRSYGCPGHDEPEECFCLFLGIVKLSGQTGTPKDFRNLSELWERCDSLKFGLQPARHDSARRARGFQEGRDPDIGVKQGDDEHGDLP
jgi:hypothetical protein